MSRQQMGSHTLKSSNKIKMCYPWHVVNYYRENYGSKQSQGAENKSIKVIMRTILASFTSHAAACSPDCPASAALSE